MIAGQLTESIEIHSPKIIINEYGEQSTKYYYKCATRARLLHNGGGRQITNNELIYPYIKTLVVRIYVNVDELDHIKWNGKLYKILDITPDKQRMNKEIRIEEIND